MWTTRTVVGIGEVLWDCVSGVRHAGGAPLNFAYICSLLGHRAFVISRIGNDKLAEELRSEICNCGLDTSFIQTDQLLPTGTVEVSASDDGRPQYQIRRMVAWDRIECTPELLQFARKPNAVYFGTVAQREAKSRATIEAFLQATTADCVRLFDVNLRPPFCSSDVILNSLALATIVKFTQEEFVEVSRMLGLSDACTIGNLQEFGRRFKLQLVCVTRGSQGSMLVSQEHWYEHQGFAVKVRNTIGAGDAFAAAVAHCWLARVSLKRMSLVANWWASWVASHVSAMPIMDEQSRRQMLY